METTATATTAAVEEFDPLDDPQVEAVYNGIKQRQGTIAAERYLLTVKPTEGMTAATPTVVTESRRKEQKLKPAPMLSAPLPTSRSLAGSDAVVNASLIDRESPAAVETAVVSTPLAETPTVATTNRPTSTSSETNEADTAPTADGVTTPPNTTKQKRKPARSTAAIMQAFEDALAAFVKADQPFKRSHVLTQAALGASFYYTYPSLGRRVDQTIANVGKSKLQTESTARTEVDTLPAEQALEPQTESTEPSAVATADPALEAQTEATTAMTTSPMTEPFDTTDNTKLTHVQNPKTGLTWADITALAAHWRQEENQCRTQISQLLSVMDSAIANAEAYERVLQLHTTQPTGDHHGQ